MTQRLWLGGYTPDMGGVGEGILSARLADDGALADVTLAAAMASPSFVAEHPRLPVLYAVGEEEETLRAFRVTDAGELTPLGEAAPAGAAACHVAIDPEGRFASVACWGSGQVLVYALDAATGAIVGRTDAAPASDPYAGMPQSEPAAPSSDPAPRRSRAHFTQFLPDGRVLTTDLGFDLARVWRYSAAEQSFELDHEVVFPYGSGPRHATVDGHGRVFVLSEYSATVFVLAPGADGRYAIASSTRARSGPHEPGEYAAHLSLSADGALLYATVRGSNVVALVSVGPSGTVAPRTEVGSGGDWPRNHLVLGERLYVANQRSGHVTVFRLGADGVPGEIVQQIAAGSPTVIVPALLP